MAKTNIRGCPLISACATQHTCAYTLIYTDTYISTHHIHIHPIHQRVITHIQHTHRHTTERMGHLEFAFYIVTRHVYRVRNVKGGKKGRSPPPPQFLLMCNACRSCLAYSVGWASLCFSLAPQKSGKVFSQVRTRAWH